MEFSAGQIFTTLRERGLMVGKDGSAVSQHSNKASFAKRIERESNVPPQHDKTLKRKAAVYRDPEKEVHDDR